MKKSNAAQILSSRKLISNAGYVELKATSIVAYEGKFIVNFNGMTQYHKDQALELMSQGEYQEAVNQNISASLRPTDFIPEKGEICRVYIENVTTNNDVTGLFVTSVAKNQSLKTNKVSGFEDFLTEDETTEESVASEIAKDIKASV